MLFVYNEDGALEVVADEAEARRKYEVHDVESGVVRFFDAQGRALAPQFPNRSTRKFLGIRLSSDPGPFEFHLAPDPREDLRDSLGPTVVLMQNPWFPDLAAVHAHLGR